MVPLEIVEGADDEGVDDSDDEGVGHKVNANIECQWDQ
jgi:hypothetical protein